jgi:hypothetical protein
MSEIWSSDELMVNMESFSDSGSEEDSLLSTWLSHAIQLDGNSTGIEYNISGKYEACGKPMEVYGTIGAYSDVFYLFMLSHLLIMNVLMAFLCQWKLGGQVLNIIRLAAMPIYAVPCRILKPFLIIGRKIA